MHLVVSGLDGQLPSSVVSFVLAPDPPLWVTRCESHAAPRGTYAPRGQDLLQQPVEVLLLGAEVAFVLRPEAQLPILDHLGVEVSICKEQAQPCVSVSHPSARAGEAASSALMGG